MSEMARSPRSPLFESIGATLPRQRTSTEDDSQIDEDVESLPKRVALLEDLHASTRQPYHPFLPHPLPLPQVSLPTTAVLMPRVCARALCPDPAALCSWCFQYFSRQLKNAASW